MAFECEIVADGRRIVEPGGNSMTRLHSQRMRWPPFLGSKFPNAATVHMPKARLAKSVCLKQTVRGLKLYVVAAKFTLPSPHIPYGFHMEWIYSMDSTWIPYGICFDI